MKPQWDNFNKSIEEFADIVQAFVENVTDPATVKNLKHLVSGFNKVLALRDEFAKLVEKVPPIEIKYPFETDTFSKAWKYYKDYLEEEYQIYFHSRREQIMLNQLKKWSGKNEGKAIQILEFFVANGYVKFFSPSDKQLAGEELPVSEDLGATTSAKMKMDKTKRV